SMVPSVCWEVMEGRGRVVRRWWSGAEMGKVVFDVKWIENEAKAGIYGFVAIKSAQCSKSRQSHEKSPSMPWKRVQENESNGDLEFYWASP
nr:hypothetical protein [Tanacetum cinerariifolium]